ncbi:hypothetical protein D7223_31395 [Micromonospora endolithica]|uniref:Uncharacterized protein n=1 Tax=Micromonospora endolithica TaxID=230091 RepID=A0A3A9YQE0_9ACTN|nr:hypothetical protein D7223_31395 [Micromonospora endolithica]
MAAPVKTDQLQHHAEHYLDYSRIDSTKAQLRGILIYIQAARRRSLSWMRHRCSIIIAPAAASPTLAGIDPPASLHPVAVVGFAAPIVDI